MESYCATVCVCTFKQAAHVDTGLQMTFPLLGHPFSVLGRVKDTGSSDRDEKAS